MEQLLISTITKQSSRRSTRDTRCSEKSGSAESDGTSMNDIKSRPEMSDSQQSLESFGYKPDQLAVPESDHFDNGVDRRLHRSQSSARSLNNQRSSVASLDLRNRNTIAHFEFTPQRSTSVIDLHRNDPRGGILSPLSKHAYSNNINVSNAIQTEKKSKSE